MSVLAVYVLDKSGLLVYELRASGENRRDTGLFRSLFRQNDGKVLVSSIVYGNELTNLIQIPDPKNQETEEISIVTIDANSIFTAGKEAHLFLCTNNGFYDYQLESGEQRLRFNNLKYGIDIGNIFESAILSDDSIIIAEREGRTIRLTGFVPFDPADVLTADDPIEEEIEKQAVTLSVVNFNDSWVARTVAEFNRSNKYYYVEINDYLKSSFNDVDDAETRFHLDLISGNIPDVIFTDGSTDSYVKIGLFADLNEFIDNDPDFNRSDYLPGLFEAMGRDGKMYEIFNLFFMMEPLMAKTADVGTDIGWTLDEFAAFIDTKPDAKYIIGYYTKEQFIVSMIRNQFINPLTGEAKLDREEFRKILEIAERFPDTGPGYMDSEMKEGLKDGDPLMYPIEMIFQFVTIPEYEALHFGEETTVKGWPSPTGNGLQFVVPHFLSIAAQAENPDGAWEFIKYCMNYAKSDLGFGRGILMPVNLSLLNELAEDDLKAEWNNVSLTRADIDKTMAVLHATAQIWGIKGREVRNIMYEELEYYLNGQKSADAVFDIIENRVGLYHAEQE